MAGDFKPCSVECCNGNAARIVGGRKGLCAAHYVRLRKHGSLTGGRIAPQSCEGPCRIKGCPRPIESRGYCNSHYYRWRKYGDPLAGRTALGAVRAWIHQHVSHDGPDCLPWPFARLRAGRGSITIGGVTRNASRYMCELAHGPAPSPRHHAAHSCGNGHLGCISPVHLSWKTPSENEKDKVMHGTNGRSRTPRLTAEQVRFIRANRGKLTRRELARMFDVSMSNIDTIHQRRTWKQLTDHPVK